LPLLLAACGERSPVDTTPAMPEPALQRLECVASLAARSVTCGAGTSGARRDIIGGQGQNVRLISSNVVFDAPSRVFSFDLVVQNLLPYPIGTRDGTTPDSGGVKVFINSGPVTTGGTGTVTVLNASGVGTFTAAGQPFFKYTQRLASLEESTPKGWEFHADAGVTTFAFTLLVQAEIPYSVLRVLEPAYGDTVVGDSLQVRVRAGAPPQMTFIRARVGANSIYLAYTDSGLWQGKVPMAGVRRGPQTLVLTGQTPTDSVSQSVPFQYGIVALQLILTAPLNGTVANPQVLVSGSCSDSQPCVVSIRIGSTSFWSGPGENFSHTVSLAPWEGTEQTLSVYSTAADGNQVVATRKVFIESSPHWQEVASGGTHMLAVDSSGILYRDSTASSDALYFQRLPSGTPELVLSRDPASEPRPRVIYAAITPTGAVFSLPSPTASYDSLFEYHEGALRSDGIALTGHTVTRGRWLAWQTSTVIFLRDQVADTVYQPPVPPFPGIADVGPNGDVIFAAAGSLYRSRGGSNTGIAYNVGGTAKTDGDLVAFRYYNPQIGLYNGTSVTVLSGQGLRFDVNNGWTMFTAYDTNAIVQGWVRMPGGSFIQATQGSPRSLPSIIGPNGELVFSKAGRRYYTAFPYSSASDVGSDWIGPAPVAFSGSTVYTFLGRTAFRILP
jgi:hypothetical protein